MNNLLVLVVDDNAYIRTTIRKLLLKYDGIDDVMVAEDGEVGLAKCLKYDFDIIILDIEMPRMDGFTFLRLLMDRKPLPVIMLSTQYDHQSVLKAMELGAIDFISKPTSAQLDEIQIELKKKIEIALTYKSSSAKRILLANKEIKKEERHSSVFLPPNKLGIGKGEIQNNIIVAIGSSTGGPAALYNIFKTLELDSQTSILVSQHMPGSFTTAFAARLDNSSRYMINIAENGERVNGGHVYVSPGDRNLLLKKIGDSYYLELQEKAEEDNYVPSVSKLFNSVAQSVGDMAIGVILTGMGNDGADGLLEIKRKNGYTIAESQETAVVYGMPKEAVKIGAVDKTLPLMEIHKEIERRIEILKKKKK